MHGLTGGGWKRRRNPREPHQSPTLPNSLADRMISVSWRAVFAGQLGIGVRRRMSRASPARADGRSGGVYPTSPARGDVPVHPVLKGWDAKEQEHTGTADRVDGDVEWRIANAGCVGCDPVRRECHETDDR
jgi:hypothetical protein